MMRGASPRQATAGKRPRPGSRKAGRPRLRGLGGHRFAALVAAGLLLLLALQGHGAESFLADPFGPGKRAAIVDQLALNNQNAAFVADATAILRQAGYTVDYHGPEAIDLDFYRTLALQGYDVLVLRTHSTAKDSDGGSTSVSLFTNQEARSGNVRTASGPGVTLVTYEASLPNQTLYFGLNDRFIRRQMAGDFDGALILNMGCEGAANDSLSTALMAKGAGAYIGWDRKVSAEETDAATLAVLRAHFLQGLALGEAIDRADEGSFARLLKHPSWETNL